MALDGAFLSCLREEFIRELPDARVDKIHQPTRDELILFLRCRTGTKRLYFSVRTSAAQVHFTTLAPENPASPPMFCMLLRKRLSGGKLIAIRQNGWERVLYFDFACVNELGDMVSLTLAAEIMGRHSNLILYGEDGLIIDAMRRVDWDMSSVRPVLPGLPYQLPPADGDRIDLSSAEPAAVMAAVKAGKDDSLPAALLAQLHGLSPLVCREIAHLALRGADRRVSEMTPTDEQRLEAYLTRVKTLVLTGTGRVPYMVTRKGTPLDFSFMPITQYGLTATGREEPSFSDLLDHFYGEKDAAERMKQRSSDILRVLTNAYDRVTRKLDKQRQEWDASGKRDQKRLYADLINANLYAIPRGASRAEVINYFDPACATVTVPLDPSLSASLNAQKYYKAYRKAQTAQTVLAEQIVAGEAERTYLDTVFDALSRATTWRELTELREELATGGYIRRAPGRQKPPAPLKPLTFTSDDGFTILVGRNNLQNDRLTLKTARGCDIWFHVKKIPGSHVIVVTNGQTPPDATLMQAAILAAYHSKATGSAQVPVDYTAVRNVKKPNGAKPGMVIYETNRTVYVTPDKALADRLRSEDTAH